MIAYFPQIYPDELVYSLLARYYAKSGYMAYTFAAQDLFISKTVRPDIEFVNAYQLQAVEQITRNITMEELIEKHTMFPFYGRFLQRERRQKAFDALVRMQGDYFNLLPLPKKKDEKRYLRLCPICAKEDKCKYGEAYWHRVHQMIGIDICAVHKCRLVDSHIEISGKAKPSLITADEETEELQPILSNNELESNLAEYMMQVFQADMDMDSDIPTGRFIHSRMEDSKYLSVRGEQRNITLLYEDITEYYSSLGDCYLMESWQLQKIFTNHRKNFFDICMLGYFLGIPAADMSHMKLPEKSQKQRFDEKVFELHEQGLKYPEIARQLGASVNVVKPIGEKIYGTHHYTKEKENIRKCGTKSLDWVKIDKETLPLVRKAIKQLQGDGITRPKKVTVFAVERMLDVPGGRIANYLPQCKAEIEKHKQSQPEYWAQEVVWAYHTIIREGQPMNWKHIRELTNMRKRDFIMCVPYLIEYADDVTVEYIKSVI